MATAYMKDNKLTFRGAFLEGSRDDWLDNQSKVQCMYKDVVNWSVPLFALVKEGDWDLRLRVELRMADWPFGQNAIIQGAFTRSLHHSLHTSSMIEREERQLRFYCYPPEVSASMFERSTRGLAPHNAEAIVGALDKLGHLTARRDKTQSAFSMLFLLYTTNATQCNSRTPAQAFGPNQSAETNARIPKYKPG